jgi:hypothetical protein
MDLRRPTPQKLTRVRGISARIGAIPISCWVALFGLWNFARTSDFDAARNLSHRMLVLTRNHDDIGLRLQAHHAAWTTSFFRGELFPGRSQCEEGRRLYDFERHRSHAMLYGGHDPGICARSIGGFTSWLIGYPDQALASAADALALAERLATRSPSVPRSSRRPCSTNCGESRAWPCSGCTLLK